MQDNHQTNELDLTRRKILGSMGVVGTAGAAAGLGTSALFSDEEGFANNILEAGEFDLKVDWEVEYYNGLAPGPETISDSDIDDDGDLDLVDDPGPIVDLEDVKPGDVIEHTLSLHLFGNPGFIAMDGLITADSDAGITEPEDAVDGTYDDADGTPDGDLDDHLQCVVWFDDGDGLPQEIWNTSYSQRDAFIDDLIDGNVSFDTSADEFVFQGTFASLMAALSGGLLLDPQVSGNVASSYPGSQCFAPSTTQYIGVLCWLPRNIPGVEDNIVQSDRLEYRLGFDAVQCRNNIANDGSPIDRPAGGVQPLTFEVTEGYGTLGGGPVDLQSDVGFPENMVTSVDTSGDPVEFVLDVPAPLDKDAGDQWSLVFDADNDGTVDFRVVFDEFFYQEWEDAGGQWGPEKDMPDNIKTAIIDGIYIVRIPRDRISDPFSVGGRLCYGERQVADLDSGESLCIGLTPAMVPQDDIGPGTGGFEPIPLQAGGGSGNGKGGQLQVETRVITLCFKAENICAYIEDLGGDQAAAVKFLKQLTKRFFEITDIKSNTKLKNKVGKKLAKVLKNINCRQKQKPLGYSAPIRLTVKGQTKFYVVNLIPCEVATKGTRTVGGGTKKKPGKKGKGGKYNKKQEDRIKKHEQGHARVAQLMELVLKCWANKHGIPGRVPQWEKGARKAQQRYHRMVGPSTGTKPPNKRQPDDVNSHTEAANRAVKKGLKDIGAESAAQGKNNCFKKAKKKLKSQGSSR